MKPVIGLCIAEAPIAVADKLIANTPYVRALVDADGADSMYVVLSVEGSSAEIVDWGYSTVDDLLAAWDNVTFENISEFV